jgi:hypothetical protein
MYSSRLPHSSPDRVGLNDADYDSIEAAVMETARGPQEPSGSANASHTSEVGQDQTLNITQQAAEQHLLRSALVGDERDSLDYRVLGRVA